MTEEPMPSIEEIEHEIDLLEEVEVDTKTDPVEDEEPEVE